MPQTCLFKKKKKFWLKVLKAGKKPLQIYILHHYIMAIKESWHETAQLESGSIFSKHFIMYNINKGMRSVNKVKTPLTNMDSQVAAVKGTILLLSSWLWEEGSNCAFNQASADWTLSQWRCTFFTHHQVSTWDEDDVDFFVHAHLTGALLLQAPQLLFHWQICTVKVTFL